MRLHHQFHVCIAALLAVTGSNAGVAQAQPAPPVHLATSAAETYAQAFYAQDLGLYQKAGVNVEVDTLATGAAVASAVLSGAADIGVATMINLANAVTNGVPIVVIAPATMSTPAAPTGVLCVAKSSPYMTAKDFDGKTIAVPALKQTADLAARAWLSKGGLDPAKAHIIEAPFSQMASALAAGTYAGAVISEPALTKTIKSGTVRCFPEAFAAIAPTFMLAAWFTTKAFAAKNPEIVHKVAAALTEAGAWANAHQYDSAAIVARVNKVDVDTIRGEVRPVYAETMRLSDIQPQLDAGYKFGFLTRPVSASELIPAGGPVVIRIETSDYDLSSEPYYGIAAGIFARHGITLDVQSAVEGGANMVRDVAAGKADVGFSNLISIAGAIQAGAPIVLIAPAGLYDRKSPPNAIVVAPNSSIHSAKDLDGKNISSPSGPGSAGALAPAAWIDQHGGDSKTVHFVTGIKPFDLPAALASGAVAAGEVGDPQLTMLLQRGSVRMFAAPFDAEGDHYLLAGFVASKAWVTANPDVARRFVAAMTETAHWANTHRTETGAILAKHLKLTPPVMAAMSRTLYAETLTADTIAPPLAVAVKYGILKPMTATELLQASACCDLP